MLIKFNQLKRHICINLALCLGALIAVLYLDRPLALWVHQIGIDQWLILRNVTEGLPPLVTVLVLGALLLRSWRISADG
jgi:hypothetical protein